ncbi:MAG: DCC1-like thiol-disulfide oxidoreductase family protein [Marinilabilia sp.]
MSFLKLRVSGYLLKGMLKKTFVSEALKMTSKQEPITVLFDGFCVLCSGFARWLHKKSRPKLRLIAMQSEEGSAVMRRHGLPGTMAEEVIVETGSGEIVTGAPAIILLLRYTGKSGRIIARLLRMFPDSWIKGGYRVVALNRYRWFGKKESCTIIPD